MPAPASAGPQSSVEEMSEEVMVSSDARPHDFSDEALRKKSADYSLPGYRSRPPEFDHWATALLAGLKAHSLPVVSASLAKEHGMAAPAMLDLARDWLRMQDYAWRSGFGSDEEAAAAMTRRLLDHTKAAQGTQLSIEIAADAMWQIDHCTAHFEQLEHIGADPLEALRAIASVTQCPVYQARLAAADPAHAAATLSELLLSDEMRKVHALPIAEWLASPSALARAAPSSRDALRLRMTRTAIALAFDTGLVSEGLALFDGLSAGERQAILPAVQPAFEAEIDDLPVAFPALAEGDLASSIAAALFDAGRKTEARAIVIASPQTVIWRAIVACGYQSNTRPDDRTFAQACLKREGLGEDDVKTAPHDEVAIDGILLLHAIDTPERDPYIYAEAAFSGSQRPSADGATARLRCSVFAAPPFQQICAHARRSVTWTIEPDDKQTEARRAAAIARIDGIALDGWPTLRTRIDAGLAKARLEFTEDRTDPAWRDRPALRASPPDFAVHPLPPQLRSAPATTGNDPADNAYADNEKSAQWPKAWGELPRGFTPVRFERNDKRAVAISLSGMFDRAGEISPGGYWIHLSDDGGKTWQVPRYTGLSFHFPYEVMRRSKLPMLGEQDLKIEVVHAEIDTRSITYPPVGLQTWPTERDLFLDIPIARLTADSDSDGVTDLAARHLLLDRPAPMAPFLVGSDWAHCGGVTPSITELRLAILARINGVEARALIEPVARGGSVPMIGGWSRMATGAAWPLFLKGSAADFACARPTTMPILIYGPQGEDQLQRQTPDFRLLEMPNLVMNREQTRGYAEWSAGWVGGTVLFWREGEGWKLRDISSWIT
ncbi:hypothetical protein DM450_02955 [Sphingomonas sp. IC081]|nr:hypothetical protein DM450_02955 [Sphingomonas sp. IC081]